MKRHRRSGSAAEGEGDVEGPVVAAGAGGDGRVGGGALDEGEAGGIDLGVARTAGDRDARDLAAAEKYLSVLYELNPDAVGGAMPAEGFYYLP